MTLPALPNLLEDISEFQEHPYVLQARTFLRGTAHPLVYLATVAETLPQVGGIEKREAINLLVAVELKFINAVEQELKDGLRDRKENHNAKAVKPADLYRKYAKTLRSIQQRGRSSAMHAQDLLTTLYLEQSLSAGDLESPEYIDAYTGETIAEITSVDNFTAQEQHAGGVKDLLQIIFWEPTNDDFTGTAPILPVSGWQQELRAHAERCRQDLGWGNKEVEAFMKANTEGYDADSDDIVLEDDLTDLYTPPTLLPNEFVLDKGLWFSARPAITAFNKARSEIFERMAILKVKPQNWHGEFRTLITVSDAWQPLIDAIQEVAREDLVTAATLYLTLAGDYGLMPTDVQHVYGRHGDIRAQLVSFAEEWENDLLNLQQDSLSKGSGVALEKIHAFGNHSLDMVADTMPQQDANPIKTASWNMGFMQAAINGADWTKAEASGWAAWREAMDPKATQKYNAVFAKTKNAKQAMAAFWSACDKRVPRPQQKIATVLGGNRGLKLDSGREITWSIVKMKIKNNELDLSGDTKTRLASKLAELGFGQAVLPLLTA